MTSSQKFAVPFRLGLKCSFVLSGLLLFVYGGALFALLSFSLPLFVKAVVAPAIVIGFLFQFRRHALHRGRKAVNQLVWQSADEWQLTTVEGRTVDAKLLGSSFCHPWLVILNFSVEGERRMWPVVMMADSTDSTSFRRLLMRMRNIAGGVPEGA